MLGDLLATPLALRLGWTLLHSLWHGLAIAALFGLALLLARRAGSAFRHALATAALLAWLAAPFLTFASLAPGPAPAVTAITPVAAATPANTATVAMPLNDEVARPGVPALGQNERPTGPPLLEGTVVRLAYLLTPFVPRLDGFLPTAALAWLAGAALLSLRLAGSLLLVRRLRRGHPLPELQGRLDELARRLKVGRPVAAVRSARVDTPAVLGWWRPVILLPVSTLAGLPVGQLELILAHELAHIGRRDHLVNFCSAWRRRCCSITRSPGGWAGYCDSSGSTPAMSWPWPQPDVSRCNWRRRWRGSKTRAGPRCRRWRLPASGGTSCCG